MLPRVIIACGKNDNREGHEYVPRKRKVIIFLSS